MKNEAIETNKEALRSFDEKAKDYWTLEKAMLDRRKESLVEEKRALLTEKKAFKAKREEFNESPRTIPAAKRSGPEYEAVLRAIHEMVFCISGALRPAGGGENRTAIGRKEERVDSTANHTEGADRKKIAPTMGEALQPRQPGIAAGTAVKSADLWIQEARNPAGIREYLERRFGPRRAEGMIRLKTQIRIPAEALRKMGEG